MGHKGGAVRSGLLACTMILVLAWAAVAWAADGEGTEPGDSGTSADQPKSSETSGLFPGVKGISGEELARRVEEYEKRHQAEEQARRTEAEKRKATPNETKTDKTVESQKTVPATPTERKEPAADKAAETPKAELLCGLDPNTLSQTDKDYLKKVYDNTVRVETLLIRNAVIRKEAVAEARKADNEKWILYHLRYFTGTTVVAAEAVKYRDTIKFPMAIYCNLFSLTRSTTKFSQDARPKDVSKEVERAAEGLVKRLIAAGRQALVGAAELMTQVRDLKAAEEIYNALLKDFPDDRAVKRSYEAFVLVRDEPKPARKPRREPDE